jgi:hypothetical protein
MTKSQALVAHPIILATWEAKIRRIAVQGYQGKQFRRSISKITRAKWTGSMAQAVGHLLWRMLNSCTLENNQNKMCHSWKSTLNPSVYHKPGVQWVHNKYLLSK